MKKHRLKNDSILFLFLEVPKVLHGDASRRFVVCGNRTARTLGEAVLPIALYLELLPCLEQPRGSKLWEWDSIARFLDSLEHLYMVTLKMENFGKSEKPLDFRGHICLHKAVYTRVPTVPSSQLSKWLLLGVGAGFQLFHQLIRAVLKRVVQLQEILLLRGEESHRFEATWKG